MGPGIEGLLFLLMAFSSIPKMCAKGLNSSKLLGSCRFRHTTQHHQPQSARGAGSGGSAVGVAEVATEAAVVVVVRRSAFTVVLLALPD